MTFQIFLLLSLSVLLKTSNGNPLIFSPNFEDKWDFRVAPHAQPLIEKQKEHIHQPSIIKREGKESEIANDLSFTEVEYYNTNNLKPSGNAIRESIPCSICKLGVGIIQSDVKRGRSLAAIRNKFVSICVAFQIQTQGVCAGFFDVYSHDVLPTFNYTKLGPDEICYMVIGESCDEAEDEAHKWNIDLPDIPKPPIESLPEPNVGKPSLKVLQISDTHFDPEYAKGSPVNCIEPLCCRSYSTPKKKENVINAGKWGSSGKCDVPLILIENMFENIGLNHPDIDYIIWTGDLPPHDIWNQTKNQIVENLHEHVKLIQRYFPNVPIFPVLGNHEGVPAGSFPPPWVHGEQYSIQWLYDEAQDQWKKWLPTTTNATIQHGGFYSVLIRPGFRIISLNTNYCSSLSWWLLLSSADPAKELKWLIYELQEAENKGEKVHIIGHIPPGYTDCLKEWSKNYNKIINRYQNTITGQFFGHSHGDEFEMFYDEETSTIPTNVAYVCPSVTTFGNFNPAYRIYYVDGEHDTATWEVLNHETWTTNLEEANKEGNSPFWYKLYSAKEAYGMESLRPAEWNKLIEIMTDDPIVFGQFYKYYYRDSANRPFCDLTCKIQLLCDLKSGRSHDRNSLCSDIENKILAKTSNVKAVKNKSKEA